MIQEAIIRYLRKHSENIQAFFDAVDEFYQR